MSHADTLYALAQIAVAFAGFAGLMAFVRERAAGPLTQVQRNRLIGMVRVALIATAFAILPIVVSAQGLSESIAWRASGALFAVAFAPITVIAWRRLREIRTAGLPATVPFSRLRWSLLCRHGFCGILAGPIPCGLVLRATCLGSALFHPGRNATRRGRAMTSPNDCTQLTPRRPVTQLAYANSTAVLAFHHTRPHWAVHIVVVPKVHIPSLTNLGGHNVELVYRLLDVVRDVAAEVEREHGACRVVTNLGRYQDSKHLHFHVGSGEILERTSAE